MIVDLTVSNFRSIKDEQTLSMLAEHALGKHAENYTLIEDARYAILRSAAVFGANAAGKSNVVRGLAAIRWMVLMSSDRKEGNPILPYEPFRLSPETIDAPVSIELEFVVPSGIRYRYEISYTSSQVVEERMYSFARRSRAVVFERGLTDNWETMKLGGTYKGGTRRFPFFKNTAYLSRAGNDASAPPSIREVYQYFQRMTYIPAGSVVSPGLSAADDSMISALSELICLADTGISRLTVEDEDHPTEIRLPEGISDKLRESILADNRRKARFWIKSSSGDLLDFDSDEMSSGTMRLIEILPVILHAFQDGSPVIVDELDANLHTDMVALLLSLFHDNDINRRGAQLIFTTHDTNVLDPDRMRRDQLWFVSKENGVSSMKSLDEYDRKTVRYDSPFEAFYRDGRLGALPRLPIGKVKDALLAALVDMA